MKGTVMAIPWALSVSGGVIMTCFAIVFAATGHWLAAGLSSVAALYASLAGRQTLMCITLAGALARRDQGESSSEGNYLP